MDRSSRRAATTTQHNGRVAVEETISGETRREEILAAATRLFAARGFDGTSTREIADDAGAKHSLLFYHFRSKGDLYLAAVLRQVQHLSAALDVALAEAADPVSRLNAYVEVYYDCFTTREPGLGVCLRELNGLPTEVARQIADAHNRQTTDRLEQIIADGMQLGVFRSLDAKACATAMTGILHMFLRMPRSRRNKFGPDAAVRQVLDVYCAGLLTR